MQKTTLYLDDETRIALRQAARSQGRNQSELIRAAIAAYLQRYDRPTLTGIGAYSSGRGDIGERAEDLFAGALPRHSRG